MKKDRPAFPNPGILETSPLCSMNGMTLREWYAGLAMQGLIANQILGTNDAESIAHMAFDQADEMIKRGEQ